MSSSCAHCDTTFDAEAWPALPLVERLRPEQLRHLVTEWPWSGDAFLEVRRCPCGATITRVARDGARPGEGAAPT